MLHGSSSQLYTDEPSTIHTDISQSVIFDDSIFENGDVIFQEVLSPQHPQLDPTLLWGGASPTDAYLANVFDGNEENSPGTGLPTPPSRVYRSLH